MWFLTAISWAAFFVQLCFLTLGLAAGLYYLAELVEEYTLIAGKVIRWLIWIVFCINLGLMFLENFPWHLPLIGMVNQIIHLVLLSQFPVFYPTSPAFIASCAFFVINHYLAFSYFGDHYFEFQEVLGYFTLCLWLVPFGFFVSLSANDQTLPVTTASQHRDEMDLGTLDAGNSDFVSNYLSGTKGKRKYGLRVCLDYIKDTLLPSQRKRFN